MTALNLNPIRTHLTVPSLPKLEQTAAPYITRRSPDRPSSH